MKKLAPANDVSTIVYEEYFVRLQWEAMFCQGSLAETLDGCIFMRKLDMRLASFGKSHEKLHL